MASISTYLAKQTIDWILGGTKNMTISSPSNVSVIVDPKLTITPPTEPTTISFHFNDKMLFTIHHDGRIEKGPGFTTDDEMSLKFWEVVMDSYDIGWWKGLIKRR